MSVARAACLQIHRAWSAYGDPTRFLYGPSCENSDDPRAVALREAGDSFDWVAYSVADFDVWDLHVGIVLQEDRELTGRAGLHVAPTARLALSYVNSRWACLNTLGLEFSVASAAGEQQWNSRWRKASATAELDALVTDALEILRYLQSPSRLEQKSTSESRDSLTPPVLPAGSLTMTPERPS